jgi:CTP:molybdopterin cytidylyltransferase MocA
MGLAIVVLAAGLGTRYRAGAAGVPGKEHDGRSHAHAPIGTGDVKQLAPLGPAGEALLDYTLYDAEKAGFSDAVIVVAREIVDSMTMHLREIAPPIRVRLVVQNPHAHREATPLGTAHATLVGATGLTTPFAVANADDLYGREALAAVAAHLGASAAGAHARSGGAVVGYAAHATLSATGGVARAVCRVDDHGRLLEVVEHTGVRREGDALVSDTATLDDSTLVSMNLWGFDASFVDLVRPLVDRFVAERGNAIDGAGATVKARELRLPDVVGELVARGDLDVTVLPTTSTWLGVTHSHDAPNVRERLAELAAAGVYPSRTQSHRSPR